MPIEEYIFNEDIYQLRLRPVVVIDKPWKEVSAEESGLLAKILGAIKHSLDTVNIVYQPQLEVSKLSFKPEKVICFGNGAKGIALYEPIEADQVSIVISDSLSDLLKNDAARKQLWQGLKKQFNL
jgi:DNA polymerase III psi subunit